MKIKNRILVLLLLLVSTSSILIANTTDTTSYKRYDVLELNSSQVEGAVVTSSRVALPIIATFNPYINENYSVLSSSNELVNIFDGSNIQTHYTNDYDITTVGKTDDFTLHYINNLAKLKFSYLVILYDKEFYSTDRTRRTGVLLHLESESLLVNNRIKLMSTYTGTDSYFLFSIYDQELNFSSFRYRMKKGYHDRDLMNFRFVWTPTSIDDINASSYDTFISGDKLVAYVFIEVVAD